MAPRSKVSPTENTYEVELILQARLTKGRKSKRKDWKYLVKWVGYGRDHNSWEPEKNFNQFSGNMIEGFWARVDLGGRDRADINQFKIGERFSPTGRPGKERKRKVSEDDPPEQRSKSQGIGNNNNDNVPDPDGEDSE